MENHGHDLDTHVTRLNCLCRICGNRSRSPKEMQKNKKPSLCTTYQDSILIFCQMDISNDIHVKHSKTVCSRCAINIRLLRTSDRHRERLVKKTVNLLSLSKHLWTAYDSTSSNQCASCEHYLQQSLKHPSNRRRTQDGVPSSNKRLSQDQAPSLWVIV